MWDLIALSLELAPLDTTGSLILRHARAQFAQDMVIGFMESHPEAAKGWEAPNWVNTER